MSQILNEENAIIAAATTRMVELGTSISQNAAEGIEVPDKFIDGQKIMKLLKAYRKKAEFDANELEAVLYCLRKLSNANSFPTQSPLVGYPLSITIIQRGATGPQGTQGTAGSRGSQGTQGSQGSLGPTGPQGTQGTLGSQGTQGTLGSQGTQGSLGVTGPQGTQGSQGTAGSNMRSPSVTSLATASSPQPNANADDVFEITEQDLTTAAFQITSGTAVNGQRLVIRLTSTSGFGGPAGAAITWQDATFGFTGSTTGHPGIYGATLPSEFLKGKKILCEFMYDTANSFNRWQLINRTQNES